MSEPDHLLCVAAGPLLSSIPEENKNLTLRSPHDQFSQQRSQTDPARNGNAKAQKEKVKKTRVFSYRGLGEVQST